MQKLDREIFFLVVVETMKLTKCGNLLFMVDQVMTGYKIHSVRTLGFMEGLEPTV